MIFANNTERGKSGYIQYPTDAPPQSHVYTAYPLTTPMGSTPTLHVSGSSNTSLTRGNLSIADTTKAGEAGADTAAHTSPGFSKKSSAQVALVRKYLPMFYFRHFYFLFLLW